MLFLKELKQYFSDPKYLHKMLEWGQAWGLLLAFFALLASLLIIRERKAVLCSLLLASLCALLTWPAASLRSKPGPVDAERAAANSRQVQLRQKYAWVFHAEAGAALLALALGGRAGRAPKILVSLAMSGALASAAIAFWLQARELQIAYPILRTVDAKNASCHENNPLMNYRQIEGIPS